MLRAPSNSQLGGISMASSLTAGVEQATDLLTQIRNSRSNRLSVVFAVQPTSVSMAIEAGANFVLGKPVQDKQLRSLLDIAVERAHRRNFRGPKHATKVWSTSARGDCAVITNAGQ